MVLMESYSIEYRKYDFGNDTETLLTALTLTFESYTQLYTQTAHKYFP